MKADIVEATTEFSMNSCKKMLCLYINLNKEIVLIQRHWIRTFKDYSLGLKEKACCKMVHYSIY